MVSRHRNKTAIILPPDRGRNRLREAKLHVQVTELVPLFQSFSQAWCPAMILPSGLGGEGAPWVLLGVESQRERTLALGAPSSGSGY